METQKWYQRGWDNLDEYKVVDYSKMPRRFWIPEGATKTVIFVDDEPFRFYEHQLFLNSSWRNWFTCLKQGRVSETCPICLYGDHPYYVGMYTIVDCDEWVDRKGVTHKNELRLYPAKLDTMKLLKLKREKLGGLKFVKFEISRIGTKSPSVGNNFEYIERMTLQDVEKLVNEHRSEKIKLEPFNYEEIFAPLPKEKLEAVVRGIQAEVPKKPEVGDEELIPY